MTKLTWVLTAIFGTITIFSAIADYTRPQGVYSTPKIQKIKNIRERSIGTYGRIHRGFMHGK